MRTRDIYMIKSRRKRNYYKLCPFIIILSSSVDTSDFFFNFHGAETIITRTPSINCFHCLGF